MNITPWIAIGEMTFSVNEVTGVITSSLPPNAQKALSFCNDWLAGRESFTITTSGSTGDPKKIEVRRDAMIASAQKTADALGLKQGMTSLVCLDTSFIAGMMMLVRCLNTGMNMIITEPSANPVKGLNNKKIDFAALVPYQLTAILRSGQEPAIATIILGGAPAGSQLISDIQRLSSTCYATFGMTETLSHIALQRLNGPARQESFHTLDGIAISADSRGCLVIDADYLQETVVTNDLVDIIGVKEFKWLGRYDNIINSGGIKVIPERIETAVANWMAGRQYSNRFFVAAVPHPQLGQQVVLLIEGTLSHEDEDSLLNSLRTALSKYEVPGRIFYKDHFVETKTGKIDRKASLI